MTGASGPGLDGKAFERIEEHRQAFREGLRSGTWRPTTKPASWYAGRGEGRGIVSVTTVRNGAHRRAQARTKELGRRRTQGVRRG